MTYAQITDVQARTLRTLTADQLALAAVRLGEVERRIRRRIPDLNARCTASAEYTQNVISVEANIVADFLANPDGYTSETDGNYSYTRSRAQVDAALTPSLEDWRLLAANTAFVITTFLDPLPSSPWVDPFLDDDDFLWSPWQGG